MAYPALLIVHIATGIAGLLLGPLAMRQDTRRFASAERSTGVLSAWYRAATLLVCLSAAGLVIERRTDLWWLVPVSALTYGLVMLAKVSASRRHRGWTHGYVHGQGGSYIALVTALIVVALVVNGPMTGPVELVPWLAPTAIGTVLIEVWRRRLIAALPTALATAQ
ncbi:hypothetical protein ALI144C_10280 [Actinosynnema sp. ALI-1.44]|uniref:hypothetical protein n=1 Tax=Actinosynnema sp. ALI-1.44 TaxID=1933779 RepID=UPI00097C0BB1|nr:hypothetical protein [Actinosynnema sp. ALI-1.44]ONI87015.1 hypothetical protein ALI144C_10280 [Actinosynnema sp. ALI-1.44]